METIDILKNNELFNGFESGELEALAILARQKNVAKNVFIIKEGENTHEMFLIKEGKVDVMLNNHDGDELILSTLQKGEIFGELALLDDKPRSANVIALEDCELLVIHKSDFNVFLKNNSNAAIQVIKYLCQKLRITNRIAYSYALMDVYERLIRYLHSVASPGVDGKLVITSALTHKEIALKICTGREVVSRMLRKLEKDHYLTIKNKTITINTELPISLINLS
jgi:CRP/FNR family transcriptional regulator, cyclic AMP receptor protein